METQALSSGNFPSTLMSNFPGTSPSTSWLPIEYTGQFYDVNFHFPSHWVHLFSIYIEKRMCTRVMNSLHLFGTVWTSLKSWNRPPFPRHLRLSSECESTSTP